MKNTLLTLLCVLLCAALVAGAVCIGAKRGWEERRSEVLSLAAEEAGLSASLEERGMDAANLAVVAARHLDAADPDLISLRELSALLVDDGLSAAEKAQADVKLTALAEALAASLPQLDGVKQSARDQVYVSALTRTLTQGTDAYSVYTAMARDFNDELTSSLTGRLAMLLGVAPLE